jgi:VanZ family protein
MTAIVRRPASWAAWSWAAYAAFVVYGSLLPFDFHALPAAEAWARFKNTPFLQLGVESRADWIANAVLYVPLGLLGARTLGGGRAGLLAGLLSVVVAAVLAFGLEFTQLFFPPRTVSQNDLLAECLGGLAGALVAGPAGAWFDGWWRAWGRDTAGLARLVLRAYALAYLLYCFFPYDLLLSRAEWASKMASGAWGWVFARPEEVSLVRMALQWGAELVLTIPIGLALSNGLRRGLLTGALLGLAIEVGQLFIATGISQGASVISRALGVGLGAWLQGVEGVHDVAVVRAWIHRRLRWLLIAYLVLLAPAAGWGRFAWGGWQRATTAWAELDFTPFYYHYFTAEAVAVASLGSTVLMYAPLAVMAWARHMGAAGAGGLAAVLAIAVEVGKLFLAGTHPDPTNVLLAGGSVWAIVRLLDAMGHHLRLAALIPAATSGPQGAPIPSRPTATVTAPVPARRETPSASPAAVGTSLGGLGVLVDRRSAWVWLLLVPTLAAAITWPAAPLGLALGLAAAAVATAWLPALALLIVPAAMPVLDLAPWSGRFFVDEFDLLCLVTLGLAWAGMRQRTAPATSRSLSMVALAVFGGSLLIAALRPLAAGLALDANSFSHLYSPFNGLRIAKGALWAWAFVSVYRALVGQRAALGRWFHAGIALGLLLTVLVVVWERAAMVGLFDFTSSYRVTGPFSVMNKGGAYIECYLAVAMAIVLAEGIAQRGRPVFWALAGLLLLSSYALLVTYSRNGYAALAGAVLVLLLAAGRLSGRGRSAWPAAVVLVGVVAAAALPVLGGSFAWERLAQWRQDFDTRRGHWRNALDLRDGSPVTAVLGVGLGRFPEQHAWHSLTEPRAAGFRLEPGNGNPFLRLGAGAAVYVEQIVDLPAGQGLQLTINIRANTAIEPAVTVLLCRKWMLTSSDCEQIAVRGQNAAGLWQTQWMDLPALPAAAHPWEAWVPTKLSISTPAKGPAIDIDNVSLRAGEGGAEFMRNGSFAAGMDRWFFTTDTDPPWHIHSLPVALLFDQGWLGLLAAAAMLLAAAVGGLRAIGAGRVEGAAALAGLAAFCVSGTLNTLIDEPRFLWLLLVLAWLCIFQGQTPSLGRAVPGPAAPRP